MSPQINRQMIACTIAAVATLFFSLSAVADDATAVKSDAVAAKKLARADHCLRCHAVDRKKEGPSFQAIAYKYKGQPDAQD